MVMGDEEQRKLEVIVARLEANLENLVKEVQEMRKDLKSMGNNYATKVELHELKENTVSKDEFKPIRNIVWTVTSLLVTTIGLAVLGSVLK